MLSSRVWTRFESKTKDGTVLKFRIQDYSNDRTEEILDMYMDYYVNEALLHKAADIFQNEEAKKECRKKIEKLLKNPQLINICYLDNDSEVPEIAGMSMMEVISEPPTFNELQFNTEEMRSTIRMWRQLSNLYDFMKKYSLKRYYDDKGVLVQPKYRGHGIAKELFKVRRLVCKEHGIPMVGGWMSAYGSQKAAERDGWETDYEISFDELEKILGKKFENTPPTCKYMVAKTM